MPPCVLGKDYPSLLKPYGVAACLTYTLKICILPLQFFHGLQGFSFPLSFLELSFLKKKDYHIIIAEEDTQGFSSYFYCVMYQFDKPRNLKLSKLFLKRPFSL